MQNFSRIHTLHHRKSRSKTARPWIIQAPFVEQSPLLMLLLYGVTTLRIMSLPKGDASAQRAAPGRAGKIYGSARREHDEAKFCIFELQPKVEVFEKISSHDRRLGHTKLRRYAFVLRIHTANRKPHARKTWETYSRR